MTEDTQIEKERRSTLGLHVKSKAQQHFIVLELFLLTFTMIFLLYLIFGTVNEVMGKVAVDQRAGLDAILDEINSLLLIRVSILFVMVFLINVLFGLFYLHRLMGPLVRIRNVLSAIADGDVPNRDVTLRKGDFPVDVAEELSRALKRIRELQAENKL